MTAEILTVFVNEIQNDKYVCHCQVLVQNASYLRVSEYVKKDDAAKSKRYNKAELFGVDTLKMQCSVWRDDSNQMYLSTPVDLTADIRSDLIKQIELKLPKAQEKQF